MLCDIAVENKTSQRLPLALLRKVAQESAATLNIYRLELGIVLVSSPLMVRISKQYAKKSKATNVLAFPYLSYAQKGGKKKIIFGDIILCVAVARKEAKQAGFDLKNYLALLVVHGMVHLAGYRHDTSRQAKAMGTTEDRILRQSHLITKLEAQTRNPKQTN